MSCPFFVIENAAWGKLFRCGGAVEVYSGTVIGCKRIVPMKNTLTKRIRINITDSRTEPALAFVGIYKGKED